MSPLDYLNLSTDLRRIAVWLQDGREKLAKPFIQSNLTKFARDERKVAGRKLNLWLKQVSLYHQRGWKSAEDALTLSVILKNRP